MRVRHGWSGEFKPNQWGKFDVTLDETDIERLLTEAHLEGESRELSTTHAFLLLNAEAQRQLIAGMVARYDYPREQATADLAQLTEHRDLILTALRNRTRINEDGRG